MTTSDHLCDDQINRTANKHLTVSDLMGFELLFFPFHPFQVGRDSKIGIVTSYGLDGPGIESRWKRDFLPPCSPALSRIASLMHSGYRASVPRLTNHLHLAQMLM